MLFVLWGTENIHCRRGRKNFTKAAQKLMISQPSVSLHIKNLEKEFQTALLNRSPKHFTTTPTGTFSISAPSRWSFCTNRRNPKFTPIIIMSKEAQNRRELYHRRIYSAAASRKAS